jgi:hypothetical protein
VTWFVESDQHICQAAGCTAILDELRRFEREIARWGDEIAWHYHHTDWVTVDDYGKERECWNQLVTFNGTQYANGTDVELCEGALNHLIAYGGIFPLSFRSGWCWENNDFSHWLEGVIPFDLSSASPLGNRVVEHDHPRSGDFDWRQAPLAWVPYHPDSLDYRHPGGMKRLITRTRTHQLTRLDWRVIAGETSRSQTLILPICIHSYSNIAATFAASLAEVRKQCAALGISYRFSTAREAFREALGLSAKGPLDLVMKELDSVVELFTNTDVFQSEPYIVSVLRDGALKRQHAERCGHNCWQLRIDRETWTDLVAAVSDLSGNSCISRVALRR